MRASSWPIRLTSATSSTPREIIRGHRIALPPDPTGFAARGEMRDEHAVGHHRQPSRNRNAEVVRRLVTGRVVGRIPGWRSLRLPHHEGTISGGEPTSERAARIPHQGRPARVADPDGEPNTPQDVNVRRDHDL